MDKGGPDAPQIAPSETAGKAAPDPEYFHSLQAAADYAEVDKRTIQNWKTREWLRVEQDGRKIRIARAELDRCKKQR